MAPAFPSTPSARAEARAVLWARRHEPHVEPLVRLADGIALRHDLAAGAVPYADPDGGGVDSRVLLLLNDPGDGAQFDTGGSGMLTILNEDQTSRKQRAAVEASGLTARRVTEEVQIISARARHLAFHHSTHPERSSNAALFAAYRWAADITTR